MRALQPGDVTSLRQRECGAAVAIVYHKQVTIKRGQAMTRNSITVWQIWDESDPPRTSKFFLTKSEAEEHRKTLSQPKLVSHRVGRTKIAICDALSALPKR